MKYIIANWKLNPENPKKAIALAEHINKALKPKHKVVICPPFVYLPIIKTDFALGSQDIFWQDFGAHTGQISAPMLKAFNVKYAIVGHSEIRALGETDEQINLKLAACISHKITPILCVGFGLTGNMPEEEVMLHLQDQLQKDLRGIDPQKVMVAYEPVWAIGSGRPASPEHAERVAMFIKIKFKMKKVLYGGSTNSSNSGSFLKKEIDGLLVGGASLNAKEFVAMISQDN